MKKGLRKYFIIAFCFLCMLGGFNNPHEQVNAFYKETTFENYYYNQLTGIEKEIYNQFISHKEKMLDGKEVAFNINMNVEYNPSYYLRTYRRAANAYMYEHPESYMWFDNYRRFFSFDEGIPQLNLIPKNIASTDVEYEPNVRKANEELRNKASEFVKTLSGTDKEKLIQIHDWLIKEVSYDKTHKMPNTRTAYGAIVNQNAICSGYAYAYKYIANLAGLDVIYVTGRLYKKETNSFGLHAWNVAKIDGEYFTVDVTIDCGENGKRYDDFLLSPINDNQHYIDTQYFDYPF